MEWQDKQIVKMVDGERGRAMSLGLDILPIMLECSVLLFRYF